MKIQSIKFFRKRQKILCLFFAMLLLCSCFDKPTQTSSSTETENVGTISGLVLNQDGNPVVGAKVIILNVDYVPFPGFPKRAAASDTLTTNQDGRFQSDRLPNGSYNVLSSSGNLTALEDSVRVSQDSATDIRQTLNPSGSLHGIIRLEPHHSSTSVLILLFGTKSFTAPIDSVGNFFIDGMPQGTYHARFLTTLDEYGALDTNLTFASGKEVHLADTLRMPFRGIPIVTGQKLTYDTLRQIVSLTWDKADTTRVKKHGIYRTNIDLNGPFSQIGVVHGIDTIYRDPTVHQDSTYEYQIVAIDQQGNDGKRSIGVRVFTSSAYRFVRFLGSKGEGTGQFSEPGEMAFDNADNVYVLDVFNGSAKVHQFDSAGNSLITWNAGSGGEARDIQVLADSVFILDRKNKIMKVFNTSGVALGEWSVDSNTDPMNFTIKSRWIFIADQLLHQILKYSLTGELISRIDKVNDRGFELIKTISSGSSSDFLYVLDSDSVGYVIDTEGKLISRFIVDKEAVIRGYNQWALLNDGSLVYGGSDLHKVFGINSTGNLVLKFGIQGTQSGQFYWPTSAAESPSTLLYISDTHNSRVQVFKR